ncbi:MAG: hypothetical protein EAX96_11100 [Candidatus Lokiarchaeota archaeon]|nr:hypothetical protein [Candidatus Lokiarchaeota archaeon]
MDDILIKNIWIIKETGENLYTRTFGESVHGGLDENLISGLFMAVANFAKSAGKDEMDSISMKNKKFLFLNKGEIFIVLGIEKETDEETVKTQLSKIGDLFIEEFKEILNNWDGNVRIFKRFTEVLDNEFKTEIIEEVKPIKNNEPAKEIKKVDENIFNESKQVSMEFPTEIIQDNPAHIKVFLSKSLTEHYSIEIDFSKFPEKPIVNFGEIAKVLGENPSLILENWNAENPPKICEVIREIESYLIGPQLGFM